MVAVLFLMFGAPAPDLTKDAVKGMVTEVQRMYADFYKNLSSVDDEKVTHVSVFAQAQRIRVAGILGIVKSVEREFHGLSLNVSKAEREALLQGCAELRESLEKTLAALEGLEGKKEPVALAREIGRNASTVNAFKNFSRMQGVPRVVVESVIPSP